MTLRFVFGMIEARAVRRLKQLDDLLRELDESLQQAIADTVAEPLKLNDFEAFARRLKETEKETLDAEAIAALLDDGDSAIDRVKLSRLSALLEEVRECGSRIRSAATGFGRYRCAVVVASERLGASFPNNPLLYPWLHVTGGAAVGAAEGLFSGVAREMGSIFGAVRRARRVLAGDDPGDRQPLAYHDFSHDEWALCPQVVVVLDSESASLETLLTSEAPLKVVLLDDPGSGRAEESRALMALSDPDLFLLRSSVAKANHLEQGLEAGLASRRTALFHLMVVEPDTSGADADATLELMRSGVYARTFPLCRYDPDAGDTWLARWSLEGNPAPEGDFVSEAGEGGESAVVTPADWALAQGRFAESFDHVPRASWTTDMIPILDYLGLESGDRTGRQPYVVSIEGGREMRFSVGDDMVSFSERCVEFWRLLQEVCGARPGVSATLRQAVDAESQQALAEREAALSADLASQIAAVKHESDSRYVGRLASRLLALSGFGPGTPFGDRSVRDLEASDSTTTAADGSAEGEEGDHSQQAP
jgi:pyruvate-ferredoxin/flavodoxin oxidoreductase